MGGALRYLLQVASTVRRTSSTYISTATLQSYPAHSHITSHGVAVVSTYFNIVGQDSDQSLVYKDGFHQFLQAQTIRMFVATCIFWAQYHTIFDIVFLNMILLMETLPEFSFPIFLAYSTEYANQLYFTITLQSDSIGIHGSTRVEIWSVVMRLIITLILKWYNINHENY